MASSARSRPPRQLPRSRSSSSLSVDQRRYHLFRTGIPMEELAARENVRLDTIRASIERQQVLADQFSLDQVNQRHRERLESRADAAFAMLEEAMQAEDQPDQVDEDGNVIPSPKINWTVRLKAFAQFREAWAATQPKSPLVAVDARNQTQINNPALTANSSVLSTESIIRQIRAERGLALGDGSNPSVPFVPPPPTAEPVFVEKDEELEVEEGELVDSNADSPS